MKRLLEDFREFAFKGNIVELAIAFVLGGASATVVNSLVDNVVLPLVSASFGQPDFGRLALQIGESEILYGQFVDDVVAFLMIALALFLVVVKPYRAINAREAEDEVTEPAPDPDEIVLLREIRDALKR